MGVPIIIFVLAFVIGLPDLAEGRVAGLSFLVVCGLVGMALALVAVHIYEIAHQLNNAARLGLSSEKPDVVANGIMAMLRDVGPVLGLAAAVYLLAPAPDEEETTGSRAAISSAPD